MLKIFVLLRGREISVWENTEGKINALHRETNNKLPGKFV
jgi:hypothetical protein